MRNVTLVQEGLNFKSSSELTQKNKRCQCALYKGLDHDKRIYPKNTKKDRNELFISKQSYHVNSLSFFLFSFSFFGGLISPVSQFSLIRFFMRTNNNIPFQCRI